MSSKKSSRSLSHLLMSFLLLLRAELLMVSVHYTSANSGRRGSVCISINLSVILLARDLELWVGVLNETKRSRLWQQFWSRDRDQNVGIKADARGRGQCFEAEAKAKPKFWPWRQSVLALTSLFIFECSGNLQLNNALENGKFWNVEWHCFTFLHSLSRLHWQLN